MNVFIEFLFTFLISISVALATYFAISRTVNQERVHGEAATPRLFSSRRVADKAFIGLLLLYVLVFGSLALLKHYSYTSGSRDLAQYDQLVWNSMHGRLLENTIVLDAPLFLAKTFTPILLAFVPLYTIWPNPAALLIVQTVALGASALPVYWFAREQLGVALGLVVAVTYFLSPALEFINLDEFHEIMLAPLLLNFSLYFLLRRSYKPFLVCLGLALLVKEEIALIGIMLGLFIFFVQGQRVLGASLLFFSGLWAWLVLQYLIPFFRGAESGSFYYVERYGYLGKTVPDILRTILTRPDIVLQHLWVPGKLEYVLHLLVPLAFVPLIGIQVAALAIPTFAYTLLSDVSWQYSIETLYPAPLVPILFFAAIVGLKRVLGIDKHINLLARGQIELDRPALSWALGALVLVSSGTSYYLHAPGPFTRSFQPEIYDLNGFTVAQETSMRSIPSDATVVAQNEFLAHVSNRRRVFEIPSIPDYRQADYLVFDTTKAWNQIHGGYWKDYPATGYFETVFKQDGFAIAKRRTPDTPIEIHFGEQLTLLGSSIPPTQMAGELVVLRPIVFWRADKTISERYKMNVQIIDSDGHVWAGADREPQDGIYPTIQWQVGQVVGDQYFLPLPPTLPSGDYELVVGVHQDDNHYLKVLDAFKNSDSAEATLATLKTEKNKFPYRVGDLMNLQPFTPQLVDMGEIRLLGYYPIRQTIRPGEMLHVGLYWRSLVKPRGDYQVAVQLRDTQARTVFEQSSRPAKDTYPTMLWDSGELLLDWHDFIIPKEIAPGKYTIWVVLRDQASSRPTVEARIADLAVN